MKDKTTEQLILESAKSIFLKKGFDGARMQEIANEANINKALVHYYFRSKDKLFDAIFEDAVKQFIPKVIGKFESDNSLTEKIWFFIETYIDMLIANPHLPVFIMTELHRNPSRFINILKNSGINLDAFYAAVIKEIQEEKIRPIDPKQLIVNMLSMCIFPIAAKPILKAIVFDGKDNEYSKFIAERKSEITLFIINAIANK